MRQWRERYAFSRQRMRASFLFEATNQTDGNGDTYCKPQSSWNFTERCDYVKEADACGGGGYLQWTAYVFCCDDDVAKWFIVAGGVLFLLLLFLMLPTSADDFFCPNLSTIVNKLAISENLAGVTFMAFGNGAPDVFTSLASVVSSPSPRADLALGGLLGGAIFVTLVVFSGVVLMKPFKAAFWSSLRDLAFFIVTAGLILLFFLIPGDLELWQPLVCLGLYVAYVFAVIATEFVKKRSRRKAEEEAERAASEKPEEHNGTKRISTITTDHAINRLDLPRPSIASRRRHSVLIPSLAGGHATEFVIDTDDEDALDDGLIATRRQTVVSRRRSTAHKSVTGVKRVFLDLLSYFAPEFEDEDPSVFERVKTYVLWPIVLVFKLTIPLSTAEWSRTIAIVLAIVSPQSFLANTQLLFVQPISGGPGLWAYVPIISLICIVFVLCLTTAQEPRYYQITYALLGFLMSASWMYAISNEVVDAVTMLGVVTGIDQAILGLTVIAWANCVGDLVSDSSVARQGFPRMAMAAATGGPLFNVLVGFGLPFAISKIKGDDVPIVLNDDTLIMITFLLISLIFTSINLIIFRGNFKRIFGYILIAIYVAFLVLVILAATGVLPAIN